MVIFPQYIENKTTETILIHFTYGHSWYIIRIEFDYCCYIKCCYGCDTQNAKSPAAQDLTFHSLSFRIYEREWDVKWANSARRAIRLLYASVNYITIIIIMKFKYIQQKYKFSTE